MVRANVAFAILETRLPLATSDAWFYSPKPHTLRSSWTIDAWGLIWSASFRDSTLRVGPWEGVIMSSHYNMCSSGPPPSVANCVGAPKKEKKKCVPRSEVGGGNNAKPRLHRVCIILHHHLPLFSMLIPNIVTLNSDPNAAHSKKKYSFSGCSV